MIVDTRNSAVDFAPIRTTMTIGEIEEKISNKFNKEITAEASQKRFDLVLIGKISFLLALEECEHLSR